MPYLFLVAFLAVPGGIGLAIACRFFGTAVGIVCLVVFGLFGTFISMVQDLSDTPDNSVGNTRRVHIRNESSSLIYYVARDQLVEDEVRGLHSVRPGELVVISGMFHPADRALACTDNPTALVHGSDGVRAEFVNSSYTLDSDDVVVLAELVQCFPRGRNIVVWDGRRAFVDPDAHPPLIDPEYAAMAYGWMIGAAALVFGLTVDVVALVLRRRRGSVNWPPPVVPTGNGAGPSDL